MEMWMWIVILIIVIGLSIGLLYYVINRFTKFRFIDKIEDSTIFKNKERDRGRAADFTQSAKKEFLENNPGQKYKPKRSWLRILISIVIVIIINVITYFLTSGVEMVVILLHLGVIWAIVEGIFALIRVVFKKDYTRGKVYLPGIIAIVITTVYLLIALYYGSTVAITNYTIDTDKNVEHLRIVQISDSHLGVTMRADTFPAEVEKIKAQNPDIVLITGDYVDDDSTKEDLDACCKALSTIDCKYGVYFSYGNHDKGYYDSSVRGYDNEYLINSLESNGVKILEDQIVNLDDQYLIIGRADKSNKNRISIGQLVSTIDPTQFANEYSVVLDHQPNDYDAESAANVDLVLSGHTHGGQLLPINRIGEYIGANDYTDGHIKIDNTDFIVSSGISAWAIRFKSGTRSEIVVVDVE